MSTIFRSIGFAVVAVSMFAALPGPSWAIPSNSHYMVSAPSCQPAESDNSAQSAAVSASRLYLINGAWAFRPGQTGGAELACPINFSGGAGEWNLVQLWYRDGFNAGGFSLDGFVEAFLMMRQRGQAGAVALAYTSSTLGNNEEYGFDTNSSPLAGPTNFRMYYLKVRLYRDNANDQVAFTGFEIRF